MVGDVKGTIVGTAGADSPKWGQNRFVDFAKALLFVAPVPLIVAFCRRGDPFGPASVMLCLAIGAAVVAIAWRRARNVRGAMLVAVTLATIFTGTLAAKLHGSWHDGFAGLVAKEPQAVGLAEGKRPTASHELATPSENANEGATQHVDAPHNSEQPTVDEEASSQRLTRVESSDGAVGDSSNATSSLKVTSSDCTSGFGLHGNTPSDSPTYRCDGYMLTRLSAGRASLQFDVGEGRSLVVSGKVSPRQGSATSGMLDADQLILMQNGTVIERDQVFGDCTWSGSARGQGSTPLMQCSAATASGKSVDLTVINGAPH